MNGGGRKVTMEERYEKAWEWWRSIGSPTKIVAPMVDQSELAFRMLCRDYGAELCYTPMINSKVYVSDKTYRKEAKNDLSVEDRPLLIQICGNDPGKMLETALDLQDHCDGIDINLGCPQGIAKKGNYGAFLLENFELLHEIVSTLTANLRVPVTCKVRKLPREEDTFRLVDTLVGAGAAMICMHGRLKECRGEKVGPADWATLRAVKARCPVPVVLNGGVAGLGDVRRALEETGVDGVMSSEAILENPGLFSGNVSSKSKTGQISDEYTYIQEYSELQLKYPNSVHHFRGHTFKILYKILNCEENLDLKQRLTQARIPEIREIIQEIIARKDPGHVQPETPPAPVWYYRHRRHMIPTGVFLAHGSNGQPALPSESKVEDFFMDDDDGVVLSMFAAGEEDGGDY